jgi:hypothetical protein
MYLYGTRMVKRLFYLAFFFLFKMKFSQRYIADMLGVACHSRLGTTGKGPK